MRALPFAALTLSLSACPGPAPTFRGAVETVDVQPPVLDAGARDAGQPDAGVPSCGAPAVASSCGDTALVRGVAHFDPAQVPDGGAPVLRLALRHAFTLLPGEEQIGGRLHGWQNLPVTDVGSGSVAFTIDMCELGTAMWSEENGGFHLVGILDLNGNNNLDLAQSNAQAITMARPDPGEPAGLTDVFVSCHQPVPCVSLALDCLGGTSCTTVTPIAACTKTIPGCASDDAFCQ